MRSMITMRPLALAVAAGLALGAAAAHAGSPVAIVPGPLVPYQFPAPEYIPAAPPPAAGASGAAVAPPLPPLVLYAAPPIALPLAPPSRRR